MLILGIILTVLGFVIFQWSANAQSKSFLERPMIFNSVVAVLVINHLWLALFAGGFYSLWKVNPTIVLVIFGIYAVLWVFGYFMGSEKAKAKKIFGIYKQLKLFRPKETDQELFRETARNFYSNLRWDEHKIKMTEDAIFEKSTASKEDKDIFFMKMQQARLGMVYKRDREIMKRVTSGQTIRVINLITSNEAEKRRYIEATMPDITLLPMPLEAKI